MSREWSLRFPELFAPSYVAYADADLEFRLGSPPDELVSRLHLLALDPGGRIVVCRSVEEWRFLPGGTRERGERLTDLAARELREEAGCRLTALGQVFAHGLATSRRPEPYRPHLPHPVTAWAYAVARVEPAGEPANPPDGESVVEVLTLPPAEAAAWLARGDDGGHADVVRLAATLGLLSG